MLTLVMLLLHNIVEYWVLYLIAAVWGYLYLKSVFYKILSIRTGPLVAERFSHVIVNSVLEYSSLFHFLIFHKLFAIFNSVLCQ